MTPSPSYNEIVVVTKPVSADVTAGLTKSGYQVAAITARHLVYVHRGEIEDKPKAGDPPGPEDVDPGPKSRRGTLSVAQAAEELGVSRSYAYELIHEGILPHLRLGRRIVIPVSALDRMLDAASS
jgi:excisionase family DNA binding protein